MTERYHAVVKIGSASYVTDDYPSREEAAAAAFEAWPEADACSTSRFLYSLMTLAYYDEVEWHRRR
jgi:hypothetical protein